MKIRTLRLHVFAALFAALLPAHAQRMPQDNWYHHGDWNGRTSAGLFSNPRGIAVGPGGNVHVADAVNLRIQVFQPDGAFVRKWGRSGNGDGQFSDPYGIAVATNGLVYVTDRSSHRIQVFLSDGTFVRKWGSEGAGDGQFSSPHGIAVGTNGWVYVADRFNHRMQVFQPDGTFVRKWGNFGGLPGSFGEPVGVACDVNGQVHVAEGLYARIQVFQPDGTFIRQLSYSSGQEPSGIAVDTTGLVYVVERVNHRVLVYQSDLTFVREWGEFGSGDGDFHEPDGVSVGADGRIYVVDSGNHRVQIFDADGTYSSQFGEYGSPSGESFQPRGIARGTNGNIFVVDDSKSRIQIFQPDGTFVRQWGSDGASDGQFRAPRGIGLDASGLVYVADHDNHRVQVLRSDGAFVRKWGTMGSGDGHFNGPHGIAIDTNGLVYVTEASNDRVQVFQADGTFVRKWGGTGALPGEFRRPKGVAIGPDRMVYVYDEGNQRIQVFQPDGTSVRQWELVGDVGFLAAGVDGLVYAGGLQPRVYEPYGTLLKNFGSVSGMLGGVVVDPAGTLYLGGNSEIHVYRRGYRTTGASPPGAVPQPGVIAATQRPGTTWMDIDYRVVDPDSSNVTVAALGFIGGGNDLDNVLRITTLEENTDTNLGADIPTGQRHRLTWNVAADWDTEFGELEVEIMANDGRGLVDFHFITIPSNGPDPELTISRSPVLDSDLLPRWYWLLATGDTAINLVSGKVYGVEAPYAGVVLAETATTTTEGRAFLFARMGVAEATAAQVQRCREGSTPGTVNQWTPTFQIGPGDRPKKVNEYGFDTGDWGSAAWWVVPLP